MKSFSTKTYTIGDNAVREHAPDPLQSFSAMQWYFHSARNTVYYTAFLTKEYTPQVLAETVRELVALAPQLTEGYRGAMPGSLSDAQLEAVTDLTEVDEFDGYPHAWLQSGIEMYDEVGVPLFRVKALRRKGGPDSEGRTSMVLVICSHALMEGSDSALLASSRDSSHGAMRAEDKRLPFFEAALVKLGGIGMAVGHLALAYVMAPSKTTMAFDAQVFARHDLRKIANSLGVGQKAVMFGVVLYALFADRQRKIPALYTMLGGSRSEADDNFFRVRSIYAKFRASKDVGEFIKHVETESKRLEGLSDTRNQFVLNAMLEVHRSLSKAFPWLYSRRFFRFKGQYDAVLTMTPPHRMYGPLMDGVLEPVYCGSYHEGTTLITYVPARKTVTFNYTMPAEHMPQAERVPELIAELLDKTGS